MTEYSEDNEDYEVSEDDEVAFVLELSEPFEQVLVLHSLRGDGTSYRYFYRLDPVDEGTEFDVREILDTKAAEGSVREHAIAVQKLVDRGDATIKGGRLVVRSQHFPKDIQENPNGELRLTKAEFLRRHSRQHPDASAKQLAAWWKLYKSHHDKKDKWKRQIRLKHPHATPEMLESWWKFAQKDIQENPAQPGQYFVIVDVAVPGGKMIGRTVYKGVREADRVAAEYRKKGRRVQVIDALWFEPGRQILQKTGMVANPTNEMGSKLLAMLPVGDVNPLEHGGGRIIFGHAAPIIVPPREVALEYTEGLHDDQEDVETAEFVVYRTDIEPDVFADLNWVEPKQIASSIGVSVGELRKAARSIDPVTRAQVYIDVAGYHGWENIDGYPLKLSYEELMDRWYPDYTSNLDYAYVPESHLWHVIDRNKFHDLWMELEKTDAQSADLLRLSADEIEGRMEVDESTQRAINRLRILVLRSGDWSAHTAGAQRNQVFKIANELGLKLPSYNFNPLKSGWSQKVIGENIAEMRRAGHDAAQAVAASLDAARTAYRKRNKAGDFPGHIRFKKNPSMTYGEVPPYGDFLKRFSKESGDDYAMHLKGSDLRAADGTPFAQDGRQLYDSKETYIGVVQLVEKWEKGDEAAGDLASGILSTLGYEWV